jgi:protein phosphatase PTC7
LSDGVGGWAPEYDPSLFSQALMYHYAQSASASPSGACSKHLQKAYDNTLTDSNVPAGSATAVAVSLSGNGDLKGINLGDSGLTVLRRAEPVYSTSSQTHYFNCPYQLTKTPADRSGENNVTDKPSSADPIRFALQPSDMVIMFTDGLSDNVPVEHLSILYNSVNQLMELPENNHLSPQDKDAERARIMADVLVAYGRMAMTRTGEEEGWKDPFQLEAKRHGYDFKGGKVDE